MRRPPPGCCAAGARAVRGRGDVDLDPDPRVPGAGELPVRVRARLLPDTTDDRLSGLVLGLGWPLVLLNVLIGTGGRLDCLVAAALAAAALVWVARRQPATVPVGEVAR